MSVFGETAPPKAMADWVLAGLLVAAFGVLLAVISPRFGYDFSVGEMPIVAMTAMLVAAGLAFCLFLPNLISRSAFDGKAFDAKAFDRKALRFAVACIVAGGLAARLALMVSEPILEDDYQRYLWDGAVTASGENPYVAAPADARDAGSDLERLANDSGAVIGRINHPDLKTIYPPAAQLAFAIAHVIEPWSLVAWRSVLLVCDLATLVLLLLLLRAAGRSPLWSALYWWNPLVIKELFNSAHMDAVVLPFVLGALLLAIRHRPVSAAISLGVAAGVKIWPILLLPLVLRGSGARTPVLVGATAVFAALSALWVLPVFLGGLDANSGFVAYASRWTTNSALFPALESLAVFALPLSMPETAGPLVRVAIAVGLGTLAVAISLRPIAGSDDLLGRASVVVAALVLLSPAQFPWYAAWFAPFLVFRPWFGFLLLTATAPLYYLGFYFLSEQRPEIIDTVIVWLIWVPVWLALAADAMRRIGAARREVQAHV